ncbi:ABC transporter ATP-binding protein [Staphylococcus felis]|uniref:ABC transporter ATP-binding protein n=1 Tax=Staphylococcus felis TaxID=46127 RepID=UPI000E22FA80|nr:ATP-binding cassette domain-containing protein [Staphylococcus felis]REH79934.1 ABC transporter ATP-binding protein [Staphylococcus felis]REI07059.1 ABC transporter ATP-binding protein [Staphylococcus felis]REI26492.1 ABC transporter ATP-binding protein [Staphylococcus felis]
MLSIKNLSVDFKNTNILTNINYDFKENSIYGLLGPNGAGKTTLFKSILKVIDYSGDISSSIHNIGHLIDYPAFYSNLTCKENLDLHAKYIGVKDLNIDRLLSTVNLQEAKNKKFKNLSMGMKQRLGIAKTLIGNSSLILLDEPSNGLDPMGIKDIRNIILKEVKKEQRITIVSSHHLNELSEFTDIFVFIQNGKIVSHLKNSKNYYSLIEISEDINHLDFTSHNEYSIIKSNGNYYILADYNDLIKYYSHASKMNLEDIYLKIMDMNIEEAYLK